MKATRPIRVFFSPLSRRFYATRAWREITSGHVECTGERFDVTNDIAALIKEHEVTFEEVALAIPAPGTRMAGIDPK